MYIVCVCDWVYLVDLSEKVYIKKTHIYHIYRERESERKAGRENINDKWK